MPAASFSARQFVVHQSVVGRGTMRRWDATGRNFRRSRGKCPVFLISIAYPWGAACSGFV